MTSADLLVLAAGSTTSFGEAVLGLVDEAAARPSTRSVSSTMTSERLMPASGQRHRRVGLGEPAVLADGQLRRGRRGRRSRRRSTSTVVRVGAVDLADDEAGPGPVVLRERGRARRRRSTARGDQRPRTPPAAAWIVIGHRSRAGRSPSGWKTSGPRRMPWSCELLGELGAHAGGLEVAAELAVLVDAHAEVEQEDVLEGDDVALHALHLGDVGDATGAVPEAGQLHDAVDGRGHLLTDGPDRAGRSRPSAPGSRGGRACHGGCWRGPW